MVQMKLLFTWIHCLFQMLYLCHGVLVILLSTLEQQTEDSFHHWQVISGQQLPKPKSSKDRDVIDPYVVVTIFGCDPDKVRRTVYFPTLEQSKYLQWK